VARIDHSFTMSEPPEKALARFRDELGPELHRKTGFGLHNEGPNSCSTGMLGEPGQWPQRSAG
jgi:hypothetical protein